MDTCNTFYLLTVHSLGLRCGLRQRIICKQKFFFLDQLKPLSAADAFSQTHPYEFLPSVFLLRSSHMLTASEKHQETLAAPFPGGDLICGRCLCKGIFQPGPEGHTVWERTGGGQGGRRKQNYELLAIGLIMLTCWLLCAMSFSRVVLLKRGLNWRQEYKNKWEKIWATSFLLSW